MREWYAFFVDKPISSQQIAIVSLSGETDAKRLPLSAADVISHNVAVFNSRVVPNVIESGTKSLIVANTLPVQ